MTRAQLPDEAASPARAHWPWWVALLASLAGVALSIVLERNHYRTHTDPGFHSFCALGRTVNCDIVSRSPYAVFLGVPVAVWGIFGYVLASVVSLWGLLRRGQLPAACGLALSILYLGATVVLGATSAWLVAAVCILCLATYGANLVFFACMLRVAWPRGLGATLGELPRTARTRPGRTAAVLGLLAGATVALIAAHPRYWKTAIAPARGVAAAPAQPHGVEPGGGHYLGAAHPILTITEFSDYECPYCRQAHTQLRELLERYPTRLRVVHRHYPLDQSCNASITSRMHQNACFAAMVAECAGRQDRFWQANDYLFAEARGLHARGNAEIARDLGLDQDRLERCLREEGPRAVALDVEAGNQLQIQGTPTFVIEGKAHTGMLPFWVRSRLEAATGVDSGAGGPLPAGP